jgi:hypothetical protein
MYSGLVWVFQNVSSRKEQWQIQVRRRICSGYDYISFKIFVALKVHIVIFLVMIPCSLVVEYKILGAKCCLSFTLKNWRWKEYIPPKCQHTCTRLQYEPVNLYYYYWCLLVVVCINTPCTLYGLHVSDYSGHHQVHIAFQVTLLSICYTSLHWPVFTHWECVVDVCCLCNTLIL